MTWGKITVGVLASFGVLALVLIAATWPLAYWLTLIFMCEVTGGKCF